MQENNIEIDIKLTSDDYADFNSSYFKKSLTSNRKLKFLIFGILGLVLFVAVIAILLSVFSHLYNNPTSVSELHKNVHPHSNSNNFYSLVPFLILLGVVISFLHFYFIGIKKKSKKLFKTNKLLQAEQKYIFSEFGFEVTSENGKSNIAWDKIYKARKLDKCYALFISKNQAYILPFRCFENCDMIKQLESLLNNFCKLE